MCTCIDKVERGCVCNYGSRCNRNGGSKVPKFLTTGRLDKARGLFVDGHRVDVRGFERGLDE